MDYRYETNDGARNYHKQRIAFIILNNQLEFLPVGCTMSHFEYCQSKGISKEDFNNIIRGFYMNGNLAFYKDNFIYDEELIAESLNYVEEIANIINQNEFDIYFGALPENNFALDYLYGRYENGSIIKAQVK